MVGDLTHQNEPATNWWGLVTHSNGKTKRENSLTTRSLRPLRQAQGRQAQCKTSLFPVPYSLFPFLVKECQPNTALVVEQESFYNSCILTLFKQQTFLLTRA